MAAELRLSEAMSLLASKRNETIAEQIYVVIQIHH
jgi:hypothetical protein